MRFLSGPLTCLVREVATDATFEARVPYDCQSSQAASNALTMIAKRTPQFPNSLFRATQVSTEEMPGLIERINVHNDEQCGGGVANVPGDSCQYQ